MKKPSTSKILPLALLPVLFLGACVMQSQYMRKDVASRVAHPAWMAERPIKASPFLLTAFERMHERQAPADIYIGGEGHIWGLTGKETRNPTPINPVALHLASKDLAQNVAYIARPCQYSGMLDTSADCDPAYDGPTEKQFAPEVLAAYNTALDDIKSRYDITDFNLIGFSGGGTIAALLAAERKDISSLRTVAAPLGSAEKVAPALKNIPQHHFIGGQDVIVQPAALHSYLQALGETGCVDYTFIQEAEHEKGWVDKWPEFLAKTPACHGPALSPPAFDDFIDFAPLPKPVHVSREVPEKP